MRTGIGEGPEGRDGILQWVQGKLEAAWDWLKQKLEPFKKQIMTIAAIVGVQSIGYQELYPGAGEKLPGEA